MGDDYFFNPRPDEASELDIRPAPTAEPATDLEDLADAVGVLIRR